MEGVEADEGAAKVEEGLVHGLQLLVADRQAAEAGQPGQGVVEGPAANED